MKTNRKTVKREGDALRQFCRDTCLSSRCFGSTQRALGMYNAVIGNLNLIVR